MNRRTHLVDEAIAVLSRTGGRGLTHRAVDEAAGLPPGSTSNVFRTRHALVGAIVDELLDRSSRRIQAAFEAAATPGAAAAAFVEATLTDAPDEVRARMALLTDPDASMLRAARGRLLDERTDRSPFTDAARNRIVVAMIDGILFDAAILGEPIDRGLVDRSVTALIDGLR